MLLKFKVISPVLWFVYAHVINIILFSSPPVDKIIVHFVLTLKKPVCSGSLREGPEAAN